MKSVERSDGLPAHPQHLASTCQQCGADLVLHDLLRDPATPAEDVWIDEWECPTCRDGLRIDEPADEHEPSEQGDRVSLAESRPLLELEDDTTITNG